MLKHRHNPNSKSHHSFSAFIEIEVYLKFGRLDTWVLDILILCSFVKESEQLIKSTHLFNFLSSYLTSSDQNVPMVSLATGQHSLITYRRRGTGVNILLPLQWMTGLILENCNKYHMMFSQIKRLSAEKIFIKFYKYASD